MNALLSERLTRIPRRVLWDEEERGSWQRMVSKYVRVRNESGWMSLGERIDEGRMNVC